MSNHNSACLLLSEDMVAEVFFKNICITIGPCSSVYQVHKCILVHNTQTLSNGFGPIWMALVRGVNSLIVFLIGLNPIWPKLAQEQWEDSHPQFGPLKLDPRDVIVIEIVDMSICTVLHRILPHHLVACNRLHIMLLLWANKYHWFCTTVLTVC